jgi:hypothetical protein
VEHLLDPSSITLTTHRPSFCSALLIDSPIHSSPSIPHRPRHDPPLSPHLPLLSQLAIPVASPCYHLVWCHSLPSIPLLTHHLQQDNVFKACLATRQYMLSLLELTRHDTIAIVSLLIRRLDSVHIFIMFWYASLCIPMFAYVARQTQIGAWQPTQINTIVIQVWRE